MNIEAGKYYRTRDGGRVFVAAKAPDDSFDLQFVGWYASGAHVRHACAWERSGRGLWSSGSCSHDIVAEWIEPRAKTVHFVMYEHGGYAATEHDVDSQDERWGKIIARKTVTLTEGDGV